MKNSFGKIVTAMVTPFNEDLSIDFPSVEKIVNHLIKTGSGSIIVAGTTGESPTLTHDEERELCKVVQKTASGKAKIILGAGSNCTRTAVESTKEAEKLGVDGILSVVPYYNKPSQAGLLEHFGQIAKSTTLPIILYNIPGRTGITMKNETIADLANKYRNIVGVKDCVGVENISNAIPMLPNDFEIYTGDDGMTLPAMSIGATGVISVASHILGNEMKEMINQFEKGDLNAAKKIHLKLFPLFEALFMAPNPTCIKAVLEIKSLCKSFLRPPLVKLNTEELATLKKVLISCTNTLV